MLEGRVAGLRRAVMLVRNAEGYKLQRQWNLTGKSTI